jgi:hypothetical protein
MYIQPLEKVGPNQRFSPPNLWKSTFEKGGAKMGVPSGGGLPPWIRATHQFSSSISHFHSRI